MNPLEPGGSGILIALLTLAITVLAVCAFISIARSRRSSILIRSAWVCAVVFVPIAGPVGWFIWTGLYKSRVGFE